MKTQRGFVNGMLMIGIALIALIAGAVVLATRGEVRDVEAEKAKAAASVVVKRVVDLIEDHRIKVANGDTKMGQGFLSSVENDIPLWPKEVFAGARGAVNEGTVTYVTGVNEEFCQTLNDTMQVSGIPTPEGAPIDRISCVAVDDGA
ncbi:cell fusion protein [Methylibium petroleiphilum]|nr:cell fusion protein [Methylibium petroleiphilum]